MTLSEFLTRLEKVEKSNGAYKARCPAHTDKKPSLSITQDGDKILLHCHAGCDTDTVLGAMGLTLRDLFQEGSCDTPYRPSPPTVNERKIVTVYDYKDLEGNVIHQTVRYEPKDFRQRRPDSTASGGYAWNLKGITPILYNLSAVVQAIKEKQPVFIVEGEKDCDTLGSLGYVATTCPLGAGKWKDEYSDILQNAYVFIIPDNDPSGKNHSEIVAKSLSGKASVIKLVDISGAVPDKGDISDFIANGGDFVTLFENAKDYNSDTNINQDSHPGGRLVCMADIVEREIEWLWYPYIAYRKITILRGDPGNGKTTVSLEVASIKSNGRAFPSKAGDLTPTTPGNVLFLTAEDDLEDTIKPRLRKARANMDRIYSFTDYITFADPRFEGIVKETFPHLVIIDPLQAFLGDGVDMHRANEIRPIFSFIRQLAEKYGFALIILEHMNKNAGGKAIYRGLGSMDITGAARSILMFGSDPKNEDNKGFIHAKSNLDRKGEIMGFSITNDGLVWNPSTTLTANMIMGTSAASGKIGRPSHEVDEAVSFLKDELTGNFVTAKEIFARAKAAGISEKTLNRAKEVAGVDSIRKDGKWHWVLE